MKKLHFNPIFILIFLLFSTIVLLSLFKYTESVKIEQNIKEGFNKTIPFINNYKMAFSPDKVIVNKNIFTKGIKIKFLNIKGFLIANKMKTDFFTIKEMTIYLDNLPKDKQSIILDKNTFKIKINNLRFNKNTLGYVLIENNNYNNLGYKQLMYLSFLDKFYNHINNLDISIQLNKSRYIIDKPIFLTNMKLRIDNESIHIFNKISSLEIFNASKKDFIFKDKNNELIKVKLPKKDFFIKNMIFSIQNNKSNALSNILYSYINMYILASPSGHYLKDFIFGSDSISEDNFMSHINVITNKNKNSYFLKFINSALIEECTTIEAKSLQKFGFIRFSANMDFVKDFDPDKYLKIELSKKCPLK